MRIDGVVRQGQLVGQGRRWSEEIFQQMARQTHIYMMQRVLQEGLCFHPARETQGLALLHLEAMTGSYWFRGSLRNRRKLAVATSEFNRSIDFSGWTIKEHKCNVADSCFCINVTNDHWFKWEETIPQRKGPAILKRPLPYVCWSPVCLW